MGSRRLQAGFLISWCMIAAFQLAFGGTSDTPTSWSNFVANAYTLNGIPLRDVETSADPTQGSASVSPSRSDIASGYDGSNGAASNCNPPSPGSNECGSQPSVYTGYYDGGTTWDNVPNSASMNDDYLFFRMRVNGDPRTNGIGLNSTHWNFLIDIDNDGFKEFWIDVDGSFAGGPNSADIVNIYFDNANTQQVANIDPAPTGSRVERYTACVSNTNCATSHTRAYPVTDLFPSDTTGEFFIEVQVPLIAFIDLSGTQQIFPDTSVKYLFSTSASNNDPLQKDFILDCPDPNTACTFGDFTPVTLCYFETETTAQGTLFHWATGFEASNLGFDLWVHDGKVWQKANETLIASESTDALEPQEYMFFAQGIFGNRFQITDYSIDLKTTWHGPFKAGQSYGHRPELDRIDWESIGANDRSRQDVQHRRDLGHQQNQTLPAVNLGVDEDGIYRVTFEDLLALGLDFRSMNPQKLGLFLRETSIPIHLYLPGTGKPVFGPGAYFEFYGEASRSLYTKTHIYQLRANQPGAKRMSVENGRLGQKPAFPDYYLEKVTVAYNTDYSFSSPNGDPWFMEKLLAYGGPFQLPLDFEANHMVKAPGHSLTLNYWGVTNYPLQPDHHLEVMVNGILAGEDIFDGQVARELKLTLPPGTIHEGLNQLVLGLPNDTGAEADLIHLESFTYTYPRAFTAQSGRLIFESDDKQFKVTGLPDQDVSIYRIGDGVPSRLEVAELTSGGNGVTVTFSSNASGYHRFWVSSGTSRSKPVIQPARPEVDLTRGPAEYLIISHPMFIPGLASFIQAKTDQGFQVKVADVEDVYAQFSGGNVDPLAIRNYIRHAAAHQGLAYVLLVGGDSYDYQRYKFPNSISFIPTLYAQTQSTVRFSPVDALLVDLNDDQVPDLPIGRFPVRTIADLDLMVQKTLDYSGTPYPQTSIFASDKDEPNSPFTQFSEKSIATLPPDWQVTRSYMDDLGVDQARQRLIDTINQGVAFANFFGHSGPTALSFQNLFTSHDAEFALTNSHAPIVFSQWGCWNSYFVYPGYNTLADKLLLSGPHGAAAVIGAATLTEVGSANLLGDLTTKRLVQPGQTIGAALQAGKQELAKTHPQLKDVILGMMVLGDPALVIQH